MVPALAPSRAERNDADMFYVKASRREWVRCLALGALMLCGTCEAAFPSPVVWFDMESLNASGKVPDKSGHGHDLTLGSGCSLVDTDRQSKGLNFDGTTRNSYATFSCPALTDRTISLWFKRAADDGTHVWDAATTNTFPHLIQSFSRFRFLYGFNATSVHNIYYGNPEVYVNASSLDVDRGNWIHMAFTVKALTGEDEGKFVVTWYKNGRVVNITTSAATNIAGAQTAVLGNNSIGGPRPVNGVVDDLRVYDVVLTDAQIIQVAASGNPSGTQLIARWDFNDVQGAAGSARTAPSLTSYATDLSLEANVAVTNGVAPGTQSLWFNGTSDTIVTGKSKYPFVPLDVTVAGWVRHSEESSIPVQNGNMFNRAFGLPNGMIMQLNTGTSPASSIYYYGRGVPSSGISVPGMLSGFTAWSHFAISERAVYNEAADNFTVQAVFYHNGELVQTGTAYTVSTAAAIGNGSTYYLGSYGFRNRVLHGGLDDFRVYSGILDGNQVRELYRGAAAPDAGEDFSVAGQTATLHGRVAAAASDTGVLHGYAGTNVWTQIAGPTAQIADPAAEQTDVTLPEIGEYTFRLTVVTSMGDARHDDVTVRRVAPTHGKSAPSVSISGSPLAAELPLPLTLSATASDPDGASVRLVWSRVSGPGTVLFSPSCGAATKATFSAVGTYVVRCTAANADASAYADATVTVTDSGVSAPAFLTNGLVHYWSFDMAGTPWADVVSGTRGAFTPDVFSCIQAAGISGSGVAGVATPGYYNTGTGMGENGTNNEPPTDRWYSFSLWMWHDPDQDVSTRKEVSLISVGYTFGLRYNCENGGDGFTLYHQAKGGSATKAVYPRPAVDPKGRWTHVVAVMDRTTAAASNESELWVDGVKQTATSGALGPARKRSESVLIGGMAIGTLGEGGNGSYQDGSGNALSRTFPGVIDEVRLYSRKLSETEIKWLAAHPRVDANEGPGVDGLPALVRVGKNATKAIGPAILSDGLGAASCRWQVLGDPAGVDLADENTATCRVTGRAIGTYSLVLEVSDGERVARSRPVTVEVLNAGTVIVIR